MAGGAALLSLYCATALAAATDSTPLTRPWQSSKAYNEAASKSLIAEANRVAKDLHLAEELPITTKDLTELYISPPTFSAGAGTFGTLSTRNYHYSASHGNKLCYIDGNRESEVTGSSYLSALRRRYATNNARINTNAAYALAITWLKAAGMDVPGLQRDSKVEIQPWMPGGRFVPVYWVLWRQPTASLEPPPAEYRERLETVAAVWLAEPDKRLLQLRVEKEQYITRKALTLPDRDLLLETEYPTMRQARFTTEPYRRAALAVLLNEANALARNLRLPEKDPITTTEVRDFDIGSPFFADSLGGFGYVLTDAYLYNAMRGNKITCVQTNIPFQDEGRYLAQIKSKYWLPKSEVDTNTPYLLATQWLSEASVDIAALEARFPPRVKIWDFGSHFVPFYRVIWREADGARPPETGAEVHLLLPDRSLQLMLIERPEYIKREPLAVPDREKLLAITNTAPAISEATDRKSGQPASITPKARNKGPGR